MGCKSVEMICFHSLKMMLMTVIILLLKTVDSTPTSRTLFFLYNNPKSWNDASALCELNSQTLLKESNLMVAEAIARFKNDPEWESYLSYHDNWIGLHREYDDPTAPLVWYDCSRPGSFSHLGHVQPEVEGLCVASDYGSGRWIYARCNRELPFICQRPAGSCPFDSYRAKKFPDTTSGLFNTTTETGCQELCRRVAIGTLECWAATYYRANFSCYLHLSEMPFQGRVTLQDEIMADVYFKNCFKAFINTYSVALNYTSLYPTRGCWIGSQVTSGVTSFSSSLIMAPVISSSSDEIHLVETSMESLIPTSSQKEMMQSSSFYIEELMTSAPVFSSTVKQGPESSAPRFTETSLYLPSSTHEPIPMSSMVITTTRKDADTTEPFVSETTPLSVEATSDVMSPETTTSTPDVTSSSNGSSVCWCPCTVLKPEDITTEIIEELVEEIVKEIKVDKQNLSSTQRKFTSAPDERTSAQGIGAIGVAILCGVFGGIMILDMMTVCSELWQIWRNFRGGSHLTEHSRQSEEIFLKSFSEGENANTKIIFDTN